MKHLLFFIFIFSLPQISFSQNDGAEQTMNDEYSNRYIIVAGSSTNFEALQILVNRIIKSKNNLEYDNSSVYDKKRGMILPDTSSDEIYRGQYYPRRYEGKEISIEMLWYYSDKKDNEQSKEMVIIAGIFENQKDAEQQLKIIQEIIPSSYIKKKKLYQGCMH